MSDPETLDDLLSMYVASPASWKPNLYIYFAVGETGKTTNGSLSPLALSPTGNVDESAVWRGVAGRLGAPGRVVIRLAPASGEGPTQSVGLTLTEPLWKLWGPQAYAAPPPAYAAPPPPQAPLPLPPTDILGILVQGMQQTQTMMLGLITKPQDNPAIAIMQQEIQRLTKQLDNPEKKSKQERDELIELATKAAAKDGGLTTAAVSLLAGPLDKIAAAMAKATETRADIELRNAETRQLVAATTAHKAGVPTKPVDTADGAEADDVEVKAPA